VPRRKIVENAILSLNMLGTDDVWQPRMGPPPGSQNALKNGRYTKAAKASRKEVAAMCKRVRAIVQRAALLVAEMEAERRRATSTPSSTPPPTPARGSRRAEESPS
jgi:hypothetical protein